MCRTPALILRRLLWYVSSATHSACSHSAQWLDTPGSIFGASNLDLARSGSGVHYSAIGRGADEAEIDRLTASFVVVIAHGSPKPFNGPWAASIYCLFFEVLEYVYDWAQAFGQASVLEGQCIHTSSKALFEFFHVEASDEI